MSSTMVADIGLCFVTTDDMDRSTHEPLTPQESLAVENALQIAARQFHEHQQQCQEVADALEAGKSVALWAPGPDGIRAALALKEQFHRQESDCRRLLAKLDGEDDDG